MGAVVKNYRFFSVGGAGCKKQHFFVFMVPFNYPVHSLQETVLSQTSGTDRKPRLCLLLVWRVGDQAFGRYRPLKGHVIITKIENLHIDA